MKQGRMAQKFILPHWWTSVIWRMPNWRQRTKKSEAILWKMILDLMQFLQNKDHQHLKWQQQKSWISYPDRQGAKDKELMQYLLFPMLKWKMLQKENSQIGMSRHLDSSTTTQMAQIMVQYGRSSRSSWTKSVWSSFGRTGMRKAIWESFWSTVGRKFPIGNACSYTVKRDDSYLCMWMTSDWLERNKILIRCGKY